MSVPTPSSAVVGWGAVAMPAKMWQQTFALTEEDRSRSEDVDRVITYAMKHYNDPTVQRMGALTSFIAQLALEKPDNPMMRAAAALLSEEIGHPYWWVEAHVEDGGMHTSVHRIEAKTPEEAEAAFREVPQIRMMSMASALMGMVLRPDGDK